MNRFWVLQVVLCLCYACSNATSNCEQEISTSYLDAAVDMITKAKRNFPTCINSRNTLSHGALDCSDLLQMGYNKSGVYKIQPVNRIFDDKSLEVYCDMDTNGGGWTLIQRRGKFERTSYKDYFFKDWKSYKEGFGEIEKDFWLGNDNIFTLSNQKPYSVRFELTDVEKNARYAQYDTFWIEDESRQYTLHIADYSGDAGDSMIQSHGNHKFTTKDQDNDSHKEVNCAQNHKGGWWYGACHTSNLNGLYLRGKHESYADGMNWFTWKEYHESMETTEIKIRPKNFRMPNASKDTPL